MANRKIQIDIVGSSRDLERAFASASRSADSFGSRMRTNFTRVAKAATIATAAIGAGAAAVAVRGVSAASDLNEEMNKSRVLFGESSTEVLNWSKTTATALGLSRRAALGAAAQFAAMFSTLELGDHVSADMSKRLVKLGADLASFSNQDPEEMLDRLRSGLAGEAEPLRRFGILISEARVAQEALRLGLVSTGQELTEQAKVQARYSLILKDAGRANDDFARTSTSLANAQRIARAQIENLAAQVGGVLLPVFARALTAFNEFLPTITRTLSQLSDRIAPVVRRFVSAFTERMPELRRIAGSVLDPLREHVFPVLREAAAIIAGFWARVVEVFSARSGQVRNILSNLGQTLKAVWTVARPTIVFLFERALPAALNVAIPVVEKLTGVAKVMAQVFTRVVATIVKALDVFLGALTKLTDAASHLPVVGDSFAGISGDINAARESLRTFVTDLDRLDGRRVGVTVETNLPGSGIEGRAARGQLEGFEEEALEERTRSAGRVEQAARRASAAARTATSAAVRQSDAFATLMDKLQLGADQAAATKGLRDDLRVARATQAAISAQIKSAGETADLLRQQFDAEQRILDIQRQIAENRRTAQQARQFRALGLTDTGETRAPSVQALTGRLASLREQVKGTVLDTAKTGAQLDAIGKVLRGKFGKVGRDVRLSILQAFQSIAGALQEGSSRIGPLTETSGLRTKQIVAGLGIDPDVVRELRGRLSGFNTAGRALGAPPRLAPAPAGGFGGQLGTVFIELHSNVSLDGQKVGSSVTRHQQKVDRRNPLQKRGPNRSR